MINTTFYQIYRCIGSKVILEFYLALQFWYSMILVRFDKFKLDLESICLTSLILFIVQIVRVFHLGNILGEFHNALQYCVQIGMVQILV